VYQLASSALGQPTEGLFVDASNAADFRAPNDPTIVRTRFVDVKFNLLSDASVSSRSAGKVTSINDQLNLNLFNDTSFTANLAHVEPAHSGGYVWVGNLDDMEMSQVILIVDGGLIVGNIVSPAGIYQIRHIDGNTHAIYQIDQSAFPPEAEPTSVEYTEAELANAARSPMADDGSIIDILVAYTADARSGEGSTANMEVLIDLAVAETNQSYANSGITQRLNLVHTEEVVYTESGNIGTDRNRLKATADGYMDNVHTLRNTYAADVVTLIVENGGGYCGIAYIMTTVSTAFEDSGFNVTARGCATGYYSFGHELGHIMSARHDWYVDNTNNSPYTYNHAYLNVTDQWRTIMGYNNNCNASGVYCTRLPYWSNPNVNYGGDPMGVAAGTSTSCTTGNLSNPACDADNHLTLNNTDVTVANFRASAVQSTDGDIVYSGVTVDDNALGNSSGNDDGVANCGETIELFVELKNEGTVTANDVTAVINTTDQLNANGSPVSNTCDFEFKLYNQQTGGSQINGIVSKSNVDVDNGQFIVELDFGADAFNGDVRWLEIGVQCTGDSSITTLAPRQTLAPAPYAIHAQYAENIPLSGSGYASTASRSDHHHLDQTWTGNNNPLVIEGSFDTAPLVLSNGSQDGLQITQSGGSGVSVGAAWDGFYVSSTSYDGFQVNSAGDNGLEVNNAGNFGAYLGYVNQDGVWVYNAQDDGFYVSNAGDEGLYIGSAGGDGVRVYTATYDGLQIDNAGDNGVEIWSVGGDGVYVSSASDDGLHVDSASDNGVVVTSANNNGIYVNSAGNNGLWVNAASQNGVIGTSTSSTNGVGVWGINSSGGWAGYFSGPTHVNGTLSKSAGSFKIDHPLDPENKYLSHSFVESPDMMNVYNGNVVLDANGEAWVDLPEWFEALNKDFRYQLTSIGAPGPNLYIAAEIADNRFKIAGGEANSKVSWQVTGIRHDPYAEQNRIPVEEEKLADEQGTYLHPAVYGQPLEKGLDYLKLQDKNSDQDGTRSLVEPEDTLDNQDQPLDQPVGDQ